MKCELYCDQCEFKTITENELREHIETTHGENEAGDKRTFRILAEVANSIDKDIQMTYEVPSDSPNGNVPYLDTMVKVVYDDKECPQGKIVHRHYVKPMASKLVV